MSTSNMIEPAPGATLDGFRQGALATLPLMPGLFAFSMAFGTVAARKGFTLFEAILMSGTVYSGVAQVIVVEAWPERFTFAAIAASAALTLLICSRFLLVGASIRPWLGNVPAATVYPLLHFLTEPPWLLATRYYRNGGNDAGFIIGSGVVTYVTWVIATVPGYWLGASVPDPAQFGLDLVMPAFFTAMLVSLWQSPRRSIGWMVGGVVALATYQLAGGFWHVVTGALAGSIVGGLIDD